MRASSFIFRQSCDDTAVSVSDLYQPIGVRLRALLKKSRAMSHIEVVTLDQVALSFSTRRPQAAELGMVFWWHMGGVAFFVALQL
jgi:hypothetical protein